MLRQLYSIMRYTLGCNSQTTSRLIRSLCTYPAIRRSRLLNTIRRITLFPNRLCSTSVSSRCWKCGAQLGSAESTVYFCPNAECRALHAVSDSTSYFELLGIAEQFSIDDSQLTKNYRNIINQLHPDKVLHLDEGEKENAAALSTRINNAYRTLQKPISRALYILQRHGKTIEESDMHLGNQFLMEMLEFNEQVVETTDADKLQTLFKENRGKINSVITKLGSAIDGNNFDLALELVAQAKYLMNIENQIKDKTYLY